MQRVMGQPPGAVTSGVHNNLSAKRVLFSSTDTFEQDAPGTVKAFLSKTKSDANPIYRAIEPGLSYGLKRAHAFLLDSETRFSRFRSGFAAERRMVYRPETQLGKGNIVYALQILQSRVDGVPEDKYQERASILFRLLEVLKGLAEDQAFLKEASSREIDSAVAGARSDYYHTPTAGDRWPIVKTTKYFDALKVQPIDFSSLLDATFNDAIQAANKVPVPDDSVQAAQYFERMANHYFGFDKIDEGIQHLRTAMTHQVSKGQNLARVLDEQGCYEEAIGILEVVLDGFQAAADSTKAGLHFELSKLHEKAGNKDEALSHAQTANGPLNVNQTRDYAEHLGRLMTKYQVEAVLPTDQEA